jgi:hypothetical protein
LCGNSGIRVNSRFLNASIRLDGPLSENPLEFPQVRSVSDENRRLDAPTFLPNRY